MICILQKKKKKKKLKFWNVPLFDLDDQLHKLLPGKGDDMCSEIVKEEYCTFVR